MKRLAFLFPVLLACGAAGAGIVCLDRVWSRADRVRIRVNQGAMAPKLQGGPWQAGIRFRTTDDRLSGITGRARSRWGTEAP